MKKINYSSASLTGIQDERKEIFSNIKNVYLKSILVSNPSNTPLTFNISILLNDENEVALFNRVPLNPYETAEVLKESDLFVQANHKLYIDASFPASLNVYLSFAAFEDLEQ